VKILVHFNFTPEQIEFMRHLAAEHGHELVHTTEDTEAVAMAADIEVLMGYFRPAVCAAAPGLRWIQSFSAGMDNYLFDEIVARAQVQVSNTAGLYAPQGGEHAWALLLALTRGVHHSLDNMRRRHWGGVNVVELSGGTLGIVGLGGFGLETLKRAAGYDMEILALDPMRQDKPAGVAELKKPTPQNLQDLLGRADAVIVACPRTPETYHLFNAEAFKAMKNSAFLVNVTRGGIIDESALATALHQKEIAGAALDVTEVEPLPPDNPLWDAPNLILTPHRAGASQHRPRKQFEFFCQNLERYLKGEQPLNLVDKHKGY
jgi:phosphoglycerate dehydrogenase-like enzyme